MKKYYIYTLFILLLILLVSCVSTDKEILKKDENGKPNWVTVIPNSNKMIYGVGSANLKSEKNSQTAADMTARSEIAKKIQTAINEATAQYYSDGDLKSISAFESLIMQVVNVSLRGVKIEDRWKSDEGTIYSLASISVKSLPDQYEATAIQYKRDLEMKKVELENKYLDLLAMLKDVDKDTSDTLSYAESLKNEKIGSIDDELSKIVPEELKESLLSYLTEHGYENE